jgi:hypothetical protein
VLRPELVHARVIEIGSGFVPTEVISGLRRVSAIEVHVALSDDRSGRAVQAKRALQMECELRYLPDVSIHCCDGDVLAKAQPRHVQCAPHISETTPYQSADHSLNQVGQDASLPSSQHVLVRGDIKASHGAPAQ